MSITYIKHGRIKCWPAFFKDVWEGKKSHEIRFNDRNYEPQQIYCLKEWDPETGDYTGRGVDIVITYVSLPGSPGLAAGYVVFEFIVIHHIGLKGD